MTPREFLDDCAVRKVTVTICHGRLLFTAADGQAAWQAMVRVIGITDEVIAMLQGHNYVVPFRPRAIQPTGKRPKRDFRAALAKAREAANQPRDDDGGAAA